ncbi:hypothetical protein NWE55_14485 [Myroides albus]|uniref:hypothetical protein n=1 Tax=Myroides albus TaxID=2562892 RepID=UPI00215936C9|nr:hypothetical protein [Myroides albus]UVD79321.1 hypothetical protein NWE55_14485 [Myroides albus]
MGIEKKKIEELISTAKRITEAQKGNSEALLIEIGQDKEDSRWTALLEEDTLQDPEKSYDLFYNGIQSLLLSLLPKGEQRSVILELKTIMLTGKELSSISSGTRGADSRMSKTKDMEAMIDTLSLWSTTPHDFFKLATLLLEKNKELGYVPSERMLGDYVKGRK